MKSIWKTLFPAIALAAMYAVSALPAAVAPRPPAAGVGATATALSPHEVDEALANLKGGDWILQAEALAVLGDARVKEALPQVQALYAATSEPWLKGRALVALANLRGKDALADALAAAKNPAPAMRASAMEALGIIGAPEGAAAATEGTRDAATAVRCQAVVACARILGEKAWAVTSQQAAATEPAAVRYAAKALVFIPTDDARKKLLGLLAHTDTTVRMEAAAALGASRYVGAIPALLGRYASDQNDQVRAQCRAALLSFSADTLAPPLLAVLKGDDATLYPAALNVLALCPTQKAYDEVAAIVRTPDKKYAKFLPAIFDLLAGGDADRYSDLFAQYLKDPDPALRAQAVKSLAKCGRIDHFTVLQPFLTDDDKSICQAVFASLAKNTSGAPPSGILTYLSGALAASQPASLGALTLLEERLAPAEMPKAVPALERFLAGTDDALRNQAAKALAAQADDDTRTAIAKTQGYLVDWAVAGPFPNDARNSALATPLGPETEKELDLDKVYLPADLTSQPAGKELPGTKDFKAAWSQFTVHQVTGRISLNDAPFPAGGKIVYFVASFESPTERKATLRVPPMPNRTDAAAPVKMLAWFNSAALDLPKDVPARDGNRPPDRPRDRTRDREKPAPTELSVPVTLVKGANRILIKAAIDTADVSGWSYAIRLVDADGKPIETLKFQAK